MRSEHVGVVTCCCCGCETVKSRYGATDTVTEGGRRGGVSRAAGAADGRARVRGAAGAAFINNKRRGGSDARGE